MSQEPIEDQADAELKLLVSEFAADDAQTVTTLAPLLMDFYQDKARIALRLRYWYVVRHLIDHLRKIKYNDSVNTKQGPVAYDLHERIESLEKMRTDANTEIDKLEKQARGSRVTAAGQMTIKAPREAVCGPEPNAPRYRGDPLTRSRYPK